MLSGVKYLPSVVIHATVVFIFSPNTKQSYFPCCEMH
jgi:hypothetical protein